MHGAEGGEEKGVMMVGCSRLLLKRVDGRMLQEKAIELFSAY